MDGQLAGRVGDALAHVTAEAALASVSRLAPRHAAGPDVGAGDGRVGDAAHPHRQRRLRRLAEAELELVVEDDPVVRDP